MTGLKVERGQRKATVTRLLGTLERHMAKNELELVEQNRAAAKAAFSELEVAHDTYNASLQNEKDINESEIWFNVALQDYTSRIKVVTEWLRLRRPCDPVVKPSSDTKSQKPVDTDVDFDDSVSRASFSQSDFLNLLEVPRVELDKFNGDPLEYQNFISLFDEVIGDRLDDDQMKLTRLLYYTTGTAKQAIRNCALTGGTEGYTAAREILSERFGDPDLISEHLVGELKHGKSISKSFEFRQLADELSSALKTLTKLDMTSMVENQQSIIEILNRCPGHVRDEWTKRALKSKRCKGRYPKFADFVDFIRTKAKDVCDPVYGTDKSKSGKPSRGATSQFAVSEPVKGSTVSAGAVTPPSANASAGTSSRQAGARKCVLCRLNHRLFQCQSFKALRPKDRLQFVKDNKLCYNCLMHGHFTRDCLRKAVCSVPECGQKHSKFIHVDENVGTAVTQTISNALRNDASTAGQVINNGSVSASGASVYLPLVEIDVNGKRVLGLLDSGSTNTFISQSLASKLNLSGDVQKYVLTTLSRKSAMYPKSVSCTVASVDGVFSESLENVLVVPSIPTRYPENDIDITKYPHLADIPLPHIRKGSKADMLIGMDNSHLLVPIEVKYDMHSMKSPYATRSLFGWALNGPVGQTSNSGVPNMSCFHIAIEQNVDNLWSLGDDDVNEISYSYEDRKVIDLWDKEINLEDGHYTLPIPWRQGRPSLPNNRYLAMCRLNSQMKRLNKSGLMDDYGNELTKMIDKGYAERVPEDELSVSDGSVWYLPHHHVLNEAKPGKIRIVFDCAARYQDVSLNNQCLQGPVLTNKLIEVLLRFRQYKYAILGDIEAMYLQVRVPLKDRNALRFLWFEQGCCVEYRMTSHLFGGVWCSSSSSYTLRQTVSDLPNNDLIKKTVLHDFYVDDMLKSVATAAEVTRVVQETKRVVSRGGFNLTKFVVNDKDLLEQIDMSERATEVKDVLPEAYSRALGIKWQVDDDTFHYVIRKVDESTTVTKRSILSYVSSMYDPLGHVSPIVIKGKMIFQECTKLGLSWDDKVPDNLLLQWRSWQESLRNLNQLTFSRCIMPEGFENGAAELHHFCDASSMGYGCCSYLRVVSPDGRVHVVLIASKGRLAPIKTATIPRLELAAAVMAVQLGHLIESALEVQCLSSTYWTDSRIVLAYIHNECKRFKVFVANRVSIIRQSSAPDQWQYVSSGDNPADVISRGCDAAKVPQIWFDGPGFLSQFKCDWPKLDTIPMCSLESDPEILIPRVLVANVHAVQSEPVLIHPVDALLNHFSSFYRAKKALCWLRRVLTFLARKRAISEHVTVDEMNQAEIVIVKHVQRTNFAKEIHDIQRSGHVAKSSSLSKLCPKLDNDVMVVGGRLKHAPVPRYAKFPIILPKGHKISEMICREFHCGAHLGPDWTLSHVRMKYWIVGARQLLKRIRRGCVTCKKLYAAPCNQMMADLPVERCEPGKPPFHCVGVDIFGPFHVTQGRSLVKRYGCIYTCFGIRAIHIEMLPSLETDAFINGLTRFVARRGCPAKILSDNGTNLVGAQAELSRSFRQLDRGKIVAAARRQNIEWKFNPPYGSHHGGLWERMIRTIRQVLVALLFSVSRLNDDVLHTMFCEVENVVNSRPLTKLSDDIHDDNPITPNHLLLLRGNYAYPWGVTQESDTYRRRWRHVQHLVTQFWRKWLKQYIPELQRRQKWLKPSPNIKTGDLVLIVDENSPRGSWPLGLIQDTNVGRDGLVRSAKIRTRSSVFVRPVTKLVLLESTHYA